MFLKRYLQSEKGMSLIEIMVGITLLSIALIPMLNYFGNSTKFTHETGMRTKALSLAQAKMENIKAEGFKGLTVGTKTEGYGEIDIDNDGKVDYPNFKSKVIVGSDYEDNSNIKPVIVEIYWNDNNQSVKLQTLIAKR